MDSLIDRISRSIAQRGYVGTIQLSLVSLSWMLFPRFRKTEAQRRKIDAEFDGKYGVDTAGVFRPKPHEVVGGNWAYGVSYQPVDPTGFLEVIRSLRLSFHDFTFLDFGSGKGRTLLLASLFPFRRIIGVEYCRALNQVAQRNVAQFHPAQQACSRIEIVESDAADYAVPNEPLVLFLFHPFAQQVMSRVVDNFTTSLQKNPRRVIVIYFVPYHAALWEFSGLFQRRGGNPAIFETTPAAAVSARFLGAAVQALWLLLMQACPDGALAFS